MRNVVTGCSGFIGGHLTRALLEAGELVCAVDQTYSPQIEELQCSYPDDLEIIWGDLVNDSVCGEAVWGADRVYHLAAETDLRKSIQSPAMSLSDDLLTTVNILDACVRLAPSARVVLASSAAVYGGLATPPSLEDDCVGVGLLSPYGIHKRACELYGQMYYLVHGLSVVCLRYFNVYGPCQMNLQAAIPTFALSILRGQPVPIRGDGLQRRDFIHVKDVVEATLFMANSRTVGQLNVGTGQSNTLFELLLVLEHLTGEQFKADFQPASRGDIRFSCADISRIRKEGWEPKLDLKTGMEDTVEYYRQLA